MAEAKKVRPLSKRETAASQLLLPSPRFFSSQWERGRG
jgi:hypothetical protein